MTLVEDAFDRNLSYDDMMKEKNSPEISCEQRTF